MSRMIMGTSPHAEPFWEATKEKKLLMQWCTTVNKPVHYPRQLSPFTLEDTLEWRESPGRGEVYAITVVYKPSMPMAKVPYAVALVDLEEGARMMTEIVNCDPTEVKVGDKVQLTWDELPGGRHMPVFELA